ncbi:MAG TPA: hypothetical protein VFT31_03730 [Kribbella sp.]|nr:hypothetical protein [Kribbella sp.]
MRQRVTRGLVALCTVLAILAATITPAANAVTKQYGDRVCSLYANSNGFGAYCSSGTGWDGVPPTWAEMLGVGNVFIPCRDFDVPAGVSLPAPPEGKTWVLRLTIVDYDLSKAGGGPRSHIERAIVPVGAEERRQCPRVGYMDQFWREFHSSYPSPVLVVKPTYTPRVNVPAYFALTPETAIVQKSREELGAILAWNGDQFLTMRGLVGRMRVDPGDGSEPFDCLMNTDNIGGDGYDETLDPFHQLSMCKHVYKRSSAKEPDGMYTVKLSIFWDVSYWKEIGGAPGTWTLIGTYEVKAVQRLPVQEVQAIGG